MALREALGIPLSLRCEIVLSLAFHLTRESVVAIAHRLANSKERNAIRAAEGLLQLPDSVAEALVQSTLREVGLLGEENQSAVK